MGFVEGGNKLLGKDSRHLSNSPLRNVPMMGESETLNAGRSVGATRTAEKWPRTMERPDRVSKT